MKFIIGKKQEMTQVWQGEKVVAVTRVKVGPCVVTQVKNEEKDGYEAVQLGFGERKEKNIKKPQKGHMKDLGNFASLKEFRVPAGELKVGDKIEASTFEVGDSIQVVGTSKGKGFQGVVKRHGFAGTNEQHGNKDQTRMPGSIGATGPAHVFKGTRMAGRMGGDKVTMKGLEIIEIDLENNTLLISGTIPGARNSLVYVSGEGELKISEVKVEEKEEKKEEVEEKKEETNKEEPKDKVNGEAKEGALEQEIKKQDK
jgi:large subunit ribosomal protein L3